MITQMKKLFYSFILIFTLSTTVNATTIIDDSPKKELTAEQKVELESITKRVEEIKSMDRSSLTRTEKKALKKEVKELKKRADFLNQSVTLSLGAIIIILLLLIIIL